MLFRSFERSPIGADISVPFQCFSVPFMYLLGSPGYPELMSDSSGRCYVFSPLLTPIHACGVCLVPCVGYRNQHLYRHCTNSAQTHKRTQSVYISTFNREYNMSSPINCRSTCKSKPLVAVAKDPKLIITQIPI